MTENGRITWTTEKRRLGDLKPWPRNPRQIKKDQVERLIKSVEEFGQPETLAIGPDNEIYNGHQRMKVWADKYGANYEVECRVASRKLTEKEREKLTIFIHKGAAGEWDFDILANEFEVDDLLNWGFDEQELGLDSWGAEESDIDNLDEYFEDSVPDAVWPSDNDWGIPTLDINLQARAIDLPFTAWGTLSRKSKMPGTWHFYVDDYRFEALWKDPIDIVKTEAINIVEPNFSCYDQMPPAVALWQIYRKRWIARWAQSYECFVIADLNVAKPFYDLNLLGIPKGWKTWATRGYKERIEALDKEYEIAKNHAGTDSILFVVYGGGGEVKDKCQSNNWLWFEDQETQVSRSVRDG